MAERNPQQLRRIDAVIVRVVLEQSRATGAVLDVEQHLYIRDPWNPTHLRRYARVPLARLEPLRPLPQQPRPAEETDRILRMRQQHIPQLLLRFTRKRPQLVGAVEYTDPVRQQDAAVPNAAQLDPRWIRHAYQRATFDVQTRQRLRAARREGFRDHPRAETLAVHDKLRSTIQLQAVDRLDEGLQHPLPRLPRTAEILECAQRTLVSVLNDDRRDITAAQQLLRLDRDRVHEARPRRAIEDDPRSLERAQALELLHRQPGALGRLGRAVEPGVDADRVDCLLLHHLGNPRRRHGIGKKLPAFAVERIHR